MDNKNISEKDLKKSLTLVILGMTFGNVFFVVTGGAALTGFTRALGASNFVYGVIMAMPVIGGVVQVFISFYLEQTGKRKFAFLASGFIHRLLWIPIAFIPFIIPSCYRGLRIFSVTLLITLASASSSVVGISFLSWMGDLVPKNIRGSFFSKRTMISTISAAIVGLISGFVLDKVDNFTGFALIFCIVSIFGALDIFCFFWVHHPVMRTSKEKQKIGKLLLEPLKNKNYMRFIAFIAFWNFGVNFAGPFFNVYMLEKLKMSYFTIVIFSQIGGNLITILFIRKWGRLVDKYGSKPIMTICVSLVFFLPILWIFTSPTNIWMVLVINLISGLIWPGFDMTNLNQSVWLAPEKNRSMYIALFTLITSLVGIAGAYICGGAFMQYATPLFDSLKLPFVMGRNFSSFDALFIISTILRTIAIFVFIRRYEEPNSKSVSIIFKDLKVKLFS
ncbi:MAG TPA: MFS transporter [Clostridiaceae bacterium]